MTSPLRRAATSGAATHATNADARLQREADRSVRCTADSCRSGGGRLHMSRQAWPCVRQASVRQVRTAVALSTVRSAVVGTVSTARTDLRYDVARFVQEEQASADRAVRADQYPAYRMYHTPAVRMRRRRFELRGTACTRLCPHTSTNTRAVARTRLRSVGHISSGKPLTASDASESDGAKSRG